MDESKFKSIYGESRNGANNFFFNPLYRKLSYSDGVQALAECGCYWLLDIIGTEVVQAMRNAETMGVITAKVNADATARLSLSLGDDLPDAWSRDISFTDLPEGEWKLFISNEGDRFTLILPTEY